MKRTRKNHSRKKGQLKLYQHRRRSGGFFGGSGVCFVCFACLFLIHDSWTDALNYFGTHRKIYTGGIKITQPIGPIPPGASNLSFFKNETFFM